LHNGETYEWGPLLIRDHKIILPNGTPIHYDLVWDNELRKWKRRSRNGYRMVWGGVVTAETTQAMARVVMSQAAIRVKREMGLCPAWTCHDELVYVIPASDPGLAGVIEKFMRVVPDWLEGCPLDLEGGVGEVYGAIK
jgi:hypothetical protein